MSLDPSAPSESDTAYDGFLSYAAEWHSTAIGSFLGLAAAVSGHPELAVILVALAFGERKRFGSGHVRDVAREVSYALGGFVVFYIVGHVVLLLT